MDVYKSNGIAQRLGVDQVSCVACIRVSRVIGCVTCGGICPTSIDKLVKK